METQIDKTIKKQEILEKKLKFLTHDFKSKSSEEVKNDLDELTLRVKSELYKMGVIKATILTGLAASNISAFLAGQRKWSHEMILKVARAIGI